MEAESLPDAATAVARVSPLMQGLCPAAAAALPGTHCLSQVLASDLCWLHKGWLLPASQRSASGCVLSSLSDLSVMLQIVSFLCDFPPHPQL